MSGDRGSASVYVLTAAAVVLLAGMAATVVGAAVVARHRAATAADLGALAGAASAPMGDRPACAVAERVVGANGARLIGCQLLGADVLVTTAASPMVLGGLGGEARVSARWTGGKRSAEWSAPFLWAVRARCGATRLRRHRSSLVWSTL